MPFRDLITPLNSSKTLNHIAMLAVGLGVYAILPVLKEYSQFKDIGDSPSEIHAALSLTLGWLLVFRTNAAYARWWEARTQWGTLINAIRNASIKLAVFARPSERESAHLTKLLSEFPRALMCHLRKVPYEGEYASSDAPAHTPLYIANQLYSWIGKQRAEGRMDGDDLRIIDMEVAKLMDVCGACERIARTPIVRSYRIFARQCISLFLFTLPWGIAEDFKWWTIPLTMVMSYFMIGMEVVAEHVEEPFGFDEDDLDLEGMCETIHVSVNEVFQRDKSPLSK